VTTSASADPGTVASKQAQAQSIVSQITSLEMRVSAAIERWNNANVKLDRISGDLQRSQYELGVARKNLKHAQTALMRQAAEIYTSGDSNSTLEVLLGSSNLDDLLDRLDTVSRVNDQRSSVVGEVKTFRGSVARQATRLKQAKIQQRQIVADRAAQKQWIQSQLAQRERLLSSVRDEIAHLKAVERSRQLALVQRARSAAARPPVTSFGVGGTVTGEAAPAAAPAASKYGGVVGIAMQFLGVPYVWGGSSPSGFDCSGLVVYAFGQMGISLPHSTYSLWNVGVAVPYSDLQAGDLVFFNGLGHMGIYMGGGMFIHAPHTGDVVKVSAMSGWYSSTYVGARRIL
jgi:cell wall-associated NlpC family hydrolase